VKGTRDIETVTSLERVSEKTQTRKTMNGREKRLAGKMLSAKTLVGKMAENATDLKIYIQFWLD
jgi:hypothetical protein